MRPGETRRWPIAGSWHLLECSFLIPIRRDANLSDGKRHSRETWEWLDDKLRAFGGATRAVELYEGWYIDPDTKEQVKDLSRKYFVAVSRNKLRRLRSLLRRVCGEFQQKCIYLSVAGYVEFVEGRSDDPN